MADSFHKEAFNRIPEEKRSRIIAAATAEFANKGFDQASVSSIAKKAGISVGSLYKYFSSKENFFLSCIRFGINTLEDVLKDVLRSEGDLFSKAEKIARLIQRHSRQNAELIRLYNEIAAEGNSPLARRLSRDMEGVSARAYTALIRQGQKDGGIRRDADPKLFACFLDNLFVMLQFSYACEYYQERFMVYAGRGVFRRDEDVIKNFLKFIRAAFSPEEK
ncbi:MAG: TetR/AcrR family transcriptional regulator [Treponema sp.]|jgi:AcrR family transcriptional regulator|nr:TetR/AcrR family transcriptional regulator [Treponema sp.]